MSPTPTPTPTTPEEITNPAEREAQRMQDEMERLQKEVETLKRLKKLQQEEQELKGWLQEQQQQQQQTQGLFASDNYSPESSPSSFGMRQIKKKKSAQPKESFFGSISKKYDNTRRRIPRSRSSDSDDDDVGSDVDVENRSKRKSSPSPRRRASSKSRARRSNASNGPVVSARVLLRKIVTAVKPGGSARDLLPTKALLRKIAMAIITDLDDETLQREDTETVLIIITLIKEAMLGMIIALAAVSLILFIDHAFVLRLPIASNFRRATFQMMNNQDTLRDLENNAGLKFMDMNEYTSMLSETEQASDKIKLGHNILRTRSVDLLSTQNDLAAASQPYPKFMASLNLDKFCSECLWNEGEGVTCEKRVEALVTTNKTPKYEAMLSTMKTLTCRRGTEALIAEQKRQAEINEQERKAYEDARALAKQQAEAKEAEIAEQKRQIAKDDGVLSDRDKISGQKEGNLSELDKFCPQCFWSKRLGVTCEKRVEELESTYNVPNHKAMISAMKKKSCAKGSHSLEHSAVNAFHPATSDELLSDWDKNKEDFCPDCEWDASMSCIQRVKYLYEKYRTPTQSGTAITMSESPRCRDSYYVEDLKKIEKFCEKCEWGWNGKKKMTCGQRVDYLTYTYRNPDRVAKLAAMKRPSCNI